MQDDAMAAVVDQTATHDETRAHDLARHTHAQNIARSSAPFRTLVPPPAQLLDAGCGAGYASRLVRTGGYHATAFDRSAAVAKLASTVIGQPVVRLACEDVAFAAQVDSIWASAPLLHVPPTSMPDVLQRLRRALRPGGALDASFVYGEGVRVRGGLVVQDHTEATVQRLVDEQPDVHSVQIWHADDPPPARRGWRRLHVLVRKHDRRDPPIVGRRFRPVGVWVDKHTEADHARVVGRRAHRGRSC